MTSIEGQQLLDSRAFASRIGIVPETLRKWVREGRISPAGRTPTGRLRFTEGQVSEMLLGKRPSERSQDIEAHVLASRERARMLASTLRAGPPGAGNTRRP